MHIDVSHPSTLGDPFLLDKKIAIWKNRSFKECEQFYNSKTPTWNSSDWEKQERINLYITDKYSLMYSSYIFYSEDPGTCRFTSINGHIPLW